MSISISIFSKIIIIIIIYIIIYTIIYILLIPEKRKLKNNIGLSREEGGYIVKKIK